MNLIDIHYLLAAAQSQKYTVPNENQTHVSDNHYTRQDTLHKCISEHLYGHRYHLI